MMKYNVYKEPDFEHEGILYEKVNRNPKTGDYALFEGLEGYKTKDNTPYYIYKVTDEYYYFDETGRVRLVFGWRECPNPTILTICGRIKGD